MAKEPMIIPSRTLCGLPSIRLRLAVGARVALVGVADNVLAVALRLAAGGPLEAGGKPAPARPRSPDRDTASMICSGFMVAERLGQRGVAPQPHVVVDALGIEIRSWRRR